MEAIQQRSIALLWNGSSGWNDPEETRQTVESVLGSEGADVHAQQVSRGVNILEESKAIVNSGTDVLVAAGGDGTINAAASALVHQRTALGVIPAGTLNHFARNLQIPLDPEEAARTLLSGTVVRVDAASVNGRVFINNSVLGLFPHYHSARKSLERHGVGRHRLGRAWAMLGAILKVFWRLPHLTISVMASGERRTLRTPFVLIGNNEHRMQGMAPGERSRLNQGQLWIYAMRPCSRWQLLRLVLGLVLGRTPRDSVFEIFTASEVTIESSRRRVNVGIDGEIERMTPPLQYRSLPAALRVIVPASYLPSVNDAD